MIGITDLATVNAGLNALAAGLLVAGYRFIRKGRVQAHRLCMLAACGTSTVFLVSYVVYHVGVGSVPFTGSGTWRTLYFTILVSHIVLATVVLPLAVLTLVPALQGKFDRHRMLARWTLPIWLYVSVTGVAVYVMLYRM